jgi:hypothetical protein
MELEVPVLRGLRSSSGPLKLSGVDGGQQPAGGASQEVSDARASSFRGRWPGRRRVDGVGDQRGRCCRIGDVRVRRVTDICVEPSDPVAATSVEQVEALWVGVWIRCTGSSVFEQLLGDDVGFELAADGRFFRIYEGPGGSLIRPEGVEQEGRWSVIDMTDMNGPGSYETGLDVSGSWGTSVFPTFFEAPPSVSIEGIGRYQRWDGAPPTRDLPPDVGESACGQPYGRAELVSVDQIEELLIGSWTLCGDPLPFRPPRADEIGIEFRADGRYARLLRSEDGSVVAGGAPSLEGTWEVREGDPAMEGPEPFEVCSCPTASAGGRPTGSP